MSDRLLVRNRYTILRHGAGCFATLYNSGGSMLTLKHLQIGHSEASDKESRRGYAELTRRWVEGAHLLRGRDASHLLNQRHRVRNAPFVVH